MSSRPEPTRLLLRDARAPSALVAERTVFGGRLEQDCLVGDLLIEDGCVRHFLAPEAPRDHHTVVDVRGRILLPRLVEPHCHLDKCHTVSRLDSVGGDLRQASASQAADRSQWTPGDLRERAERGLAELHASGCGAVRTHIDWAVERAPAGAAPHAWEVIGELAEQASRQMIVQRCALLPLESFDDQDYVIGVARRLSSNEGVLGVFVLGQSNMSARLRKVFELAERFSLALDFHVDESLEAGLEGLATIASLVIESEFQGPVLCGHACSLMNLEGDALTRVTEIIARAGIAIVALPSTNLYLQGRCAGTPQRRGITRVRELAQAGVTVAFGSDNVADAFCPVGRLDPINSLALAVLTAHLDPPYARWLRAVTTDARAAIGLDPVPLDQARAADLLIVEATHTSDVVRGAPRLPLDEYLLTGAGTPGSITELRGSAG